MKKLTRDDLRKVMGGTNAPDDKACVTDSDCGSKNVTCGEQQNQRRGTVITKSAVGIGYAKMMTSLNVAVVATSWPRFVFPLSI